MSHRESTRILHRINKSRTESSCTNYSLNITKNNNQIRLTLNQHVTPPMLTISLRQSRKHSQKYDHSSTEHGTNLVTMKTTPLARPPSTIDHNIAQTMNIYSLSPGGTETQRQQCKNCVEIALMGNTHHDGDNLSSDSHTDERMWQRHNLTVNIFCRITWGHPPLAHKPGKHI